MNRVEEAMANKHLEDCAHCGERPRLELSATEPLWRVACGCGLLTAWSADLGAIVYTWNRRPPLRVLKALREEYFKLTAARLGREPEAPWEPLGAARQLTTPLLEPLTISNPEPGHFTVRSGGRWEHHLDSGEALYCVSLYVIKRTTAYLKDEAGHRRFWEALKMAPPEEDWL